MKSSKYSLTVYACYLGYIVQAVINNLSPLLFLTFQQSFGISVSRIGLLIFFNFGVQIIVDALAAKFVDKIGCRKCIVAAHVFSFLGLVGMSVLPFLLPSPYAGLLLAAFLNAIGGGLIEVLISPIVEATPSSGAKEAAMSLLHSFYCWGHVAVVLLSTLGFRIFGLERWYVLPLLWSILPLVNALFFTRVPIIQPAHTSEHTLMHELLNSRTFWGFFLLMLCAGASEQAMSQWASFFAESGLDLSKTAGDLLGPCIFAALMGGSRMLFGKLGDRLSLRPFMQASCVLCIISYAFAILSPWPAAALVGCALCGLSVGIMWPGTFSLASKGMPHGGTAMFALLALAGDIGCAAGPETVGFFSGLAPQYGIKAGLLAAVAFPIVMLVLLVSQHRTLPQ